LAELRKVVLAVLVVGNGGDGWCWAPRRWSSWVFLGSDFNKLAIQKATCFANSNASGKNGGSAT
jgi:hypothetical protein